MTANSVNPFDCLPDELIEHIFFAIIYSPPVEPYNHVNNIASSTFYFSHSLHEPYLRHTYKDLTSLELVCRRFYNLLRSSTFWLQKCHRDHVAIGNEPLAISTGIDFRRLYFSNPFHPDYNLLNLNNSNQDQVNQFWTPNVSREETPVGSDLLYDEFGLVSSCYATSYAWGQYQRDNVQLLRKGEEKLISINPVIEFTVCVAGRWDCSSICNLELCFSNGHEWKYQRSFSNGDCQWHRLIYRYVNYRPNEMPSHVSIILKGKDQRFWAGNYGAKFAQIKLRLALRQENETENQEFEETMLNSHIPHVA
ncbi:unnamed protein product [Rotaria socialis]|uniref:FBA domain-containing protein n=1 Tax=Rotaria socialis TaxID=392032 RepID=A0A820UNT9_9BILA|nr:unnamed protein product [Rotaria socialis]CAF4488080.1 unnamed protein product [Rotaria socialis]